MIDEMRIDELVEVLEDAYDKKEQAQVITKDAQTMIKDWAERNELNVKNVKAVFKDYCSFRAGKLKWGDEADDDDFTQLLVQVMDRVVGDNK